MKNMLIEEIRKNRMEHTKECGSDLGSICRDLETLQDKSDHKVVRLQPRKISKKAT